MKSKVLYYTFAFVGLVTALSCGDRTPMNGDDNGITTQFNLKETSVGLEVQLEWDPIIDDGLVRYYVYRAENEGNFTILDSVSKLLSLLSSGTSSPSYLLFQP